MAIGRADLTWVKNFRLTPRATGAPACEVSGALPLKRQAGSIDRRGPRFGTRFGTRLRARERERVRLYGPYYTPPTLIAITAKRCISAIIASASDAVLEGLHTRTQSLAVRPLGVYEPPPPGSRQLVIPTGRCKIINCGYTSWRAIDTLIFPYVLSRAC